MATIKEIIDSYCGETNIPKSSSYVGNTQPGAVQMLALFRKVGDALRNMPLQWTQLKRGYVFTTVTDQQSYALPGDFYRILESTQWDTTNQWPLYGPISDAAAALRDYGVVNITTRKGYRILGPVNHLISTAPYSKRASGKFTLDQASENSTDELYLGYLSCNYIWPRDWVASTAYSAGDIRSGNGFVYICTLGGTSGATRPSVATGTEVDGTVTWTVYTEPYLVNAANTKLNDADICLFDENLMIQGLAWAFMASKGLDYKQARFDWENEAKGAFSRFDGPSKINMAQRDPDWSDALNIREGSWDL